MAKAPATELPVIIIGTGAEARLAADYLQLSGKTVYGFLTLLREEGSKKGPEDLNDLPIHGALSDPAFQKMLKNEKLDYHIAESEAARRLALGKEMFDLTGRHSLTATHPSASISPSVEVLAGCLIGPGVSIGPNTRIGTLVALHAGVHIGADAQVGDGATLNAGALVGAGAHLGQEVYLGLGATVNGKVNVAGKANVGAGSVVLRDVKAGETVFGVPAQAVK